MPFPTSGSLTSGYQLTNSLRFRSSASAYLSRTPASAGNRKTWTWSGWVKRGTLGVDNNSLIGINSPNANQSIDAFTLRFLASDVLRVFISNSSGTSVILADTVAVFRDPSAWYHIVLTLDTTQATNSNGVKLYVNGVQQTLSFTAYTQNFESYFNSTQAQYIGRSVNNIYFDGYLTEINFIDGQALTPSSFGSTNALTGVWQPAKYTGTYGTNGFYLPFTDNSALTSGSNAGLGKDFSGNANYWNTNNISLTPTVVRQSFTTTGSTTWTAPTGVTSVDYLVIAGGGGGGSGAGGGGGAGGYLTGTATVVPGISYTLTVGAGGAGGAGTGAFSGFAGANGGNSVFGSFTAIGGGGGAGVSAGESPGKNGGSGGGGLSWNTSAGGSGTSGQGNNGATGYNDGTVRIGGGGGGAGANGGQGGGGNGLASSITGTSVTRGGGGGGGEFFGYVGVQAGGTGGGGNGGSGAGVGATAGTANTGGGGGGGYVDAAGNASSGANGGSGIVILSYSVNSSGTYDSMTDVPTLTNQTTANYCVFNPSENQSSVTYLNPTLTNGNLQMTANASFQIYATGSIKFSSGKFYIEYTVAGMGNAAATYAGVGAASYVSDGSIAGCTPSTAGATYTTNDVIGIAIDADANTVSFYKNGALQGSANRTITTPSQYAVVVSAQSSSGSWILNCGQLPFVYAPPTGFVALNTFNLPNSTIVKGNTVMDATLYTGNGSTQTITNAGSFQPDLVWIKSRSNAYSNVLQNTVAGITNYLSSDLTSAEASGGANTVTSVNSNGFSLGSGTSWNNNGSSFVGWQWQAGQGTTSTNTNGSITSTVSVSAPAGFSVVTYTGTGANATVGHGLGVAPKFMIVKERSAVQNWAVYAIAAGGADRYLSLNTTSAYTLDSTVFQSVDPTSSVFSIGTSGLTNASTQTYVAYCFAPITGYSKFGSYTGNGSADGPFIYLGFRPKFVMIKCSSTGGANYNWFMYDSVRDTYNITQQLLRADTSGAEASTPLLDILSNGFKIRNSDATINGSGSTYVYACFAESPFKNSLAR